MKGYTSLDKLVSKSPSYVRMVYHWVKPLVYVFFEMTERNAREIGRDVGLKDYAMKQPQPQ